MKDLKIILGFMFICFHFSSNSQKAKVSSNFHYQDSQKFSEIADSILGAAKENDIPAISFAVIENGEIALSKGFGHLNRESEVEVDAKSLYQIGSQTKVFTGVIANHLIAQNLLDPNRSIVDYLDHELSVENKSKFQVIKLSSLLKHTAGLPRSASLISRERQGNDPWIKGYSRDQFVEDLNNIELQYAPDERWEYSNFGYGVIGVICENVSGLSYGELLRKYITKPYGLINTTLDLNIEQKSNLAQPYDKENRSKRLVPYVMGVMTPASAAYSNIEDLSHFMIQQLEAFKNVDEGPIGNPLLTTKDVAPILFEENVFYGYGLFKMESEMGAIYGHGGDMDGYACEYRFCPKLNVGLIMLTSSGGDWIDRTFQSNFMEIMKQVAQGH